MIAAEELDVTSANISDGGAERSRHRAIARSESGNGAHWVRRGGPGTSSQTSATTAKCSSATSKAAPIGWSGAQRPVDGAAYVRTTPEIAAEAGRQQEDRRFCRVRGRCCCPARRVDSKPW
jgi:hypothetical protein